MARIDYTSLDLKERVVFINRVAKVVKGVVFPSALL